MKIGDFSISGNLNEIRERIKYEVDNTARPINKSRTIIGKLNQREDFDINLFTATKYDQNEFQDFLKRMKFRIVKQIGIYENSKDSSRLIPYALYILQALT